MCVEQDRFLSCSVPRYGEFYTIEQTSCPIYRVVWSYINNKTYADVFVDVSDTKCSWNTIK